MLRTIQIRYYAQLRDALRTGGESVELELPIREREILSHLAGLHPKQRDLFYASRVAVDENYIDAGALLEDFTEVDIISPVSGG